MPSSLSAHLRQLREARGLSLADVARQTRMPEHVLRRIETDDLDALPGGSYARVYARAYARALGADAESVIEAHATEFPDYRRPDTPPTVPRASGRWTLTPFVIAVLLIITVAVAVALLAGRRSSPPAQASRAADSGPAGSYGADRSDLT